MRSESPRRYALAALVLSAGASTVACSSPHSFVVLNLELAPASPHISGIQSIRVEVTQGTASIQDLSYPAPGLVIDALAPTGDDGGATDADGGAGSPKTLSVEFSNGVKGTVSFDVSAIDGSGCTIGHGRADVAIRRGAVAQGIIAFVPRHDCTGDGGAMDGGGDDGATFAGCDPTSPSSGPGLLCPAGQLCQVDCPNQKTDCVPGGTGAPGSLCTTNADCAPGSQCFDYGSTGCAAKVCLQFCHTAADCAAFGAGGGGSGSVCEGLVPCNGMLTTYHTCTFNCDPTAAAASRHGGCPAALVCVMPASMDAVDCACAETTRTKTEGQTCASGAECAPGLICNQMGTSKTCRPICRCDGQNGACTPGAGSCPTAGTTCHPVTNQTLFGVCL